MNNTDINIRLSLFCVSRSSATPRLQPEYLHHDEDFAIGLHMYVSSGDQRS